MFLHIGEGKILSKKEIIGIFDLETTSVGKKNKRISAEKRKKRKYGIYKCRNSKDIYNN